MKRKAKKLVLENGEEFYGVGFGADIRRVCEVVFNTSVVGYQEIISDPSYTGQILVMTYPLIGNYGITDEDYETRTPTIGGMVVRECCDTPSNFRYTRTIEEELEDHGIPCLGEVDTRRLTRLLRSSKRLRGAIVEAEMPTAEALALIEATPPETTMVAQVSCRKRWLSRTPSHKYHVVAVDCGIKYSVIRMLNRLGCNVTIVPYNTSVQDIVALRPDGVLISNGPDGPSGVPEAGETLRALRGRYPIFGIGLGHELIGLMYGARLEPAGCGLHGDHSVRELSSHRISVAVLNQSYVFTSIEGTGLTPTFVMVPEGYVVGFERPEDKIFSVQFNPESAPGPQDNLDLFDKFIKMMEEQKNA